MIFKLLIILFLSISIFAQQREIHYYELKYISATEILPYIEKMISHEGDIRYQPVRNSIQVSDYPEQLKKIQEFIENNDIPPQLYKISIKVYEASPFNKKVTITKETEILTLKLNKITPFRSYEILDEISIEAKPGSKILQTVGKDFQISFYLKRFIGNPKIIKLLDLEFSKIEKGEKNTKIIRPLIKTSINLILSNTQILGASSYQKDGKALIFVFNATTK